MSSDADHRPTWWEVVEDEVARRAADADTGATVDADRDGGDGAGEGLPDPWRDAVASPGGLTAEQAAVLAGLDDQPGVPHLTGDGHAEGASDEVVADQPPLAHLHDDRGDDPST